MFAGIFVGWCVWFACFCFAMLMNAERKHEAINITACLMWIMGFMFLGAIIGYLLDAKITGSVTWPMI